MLKPHGVWAVIAPFNFPFALAGGPIGAALVAGNTVVFKTASDTAWSGRLLMDVFEAAGLPPGVLNLVSGAGAEVGDALMRHPAVAGATFTGSHAVGMELLRHFAAGARPRPLIAEMGGKNAAIVTRHADLERAATGIVRSAFGLQGQKCSACSRVYVERPVAAALRQRLLERSAAIAVGDPTVAAHWMGPVINAAAVAALPPCRRATQRRGSAVLRWPGAERRRLGARALRGTDHRGHRAGATACGATSSSCRALAAARRHRSDPAAPTLRAMPNPPSPQVKHLRQVLLWPLRLMPLPEGTSARPWELLTPTWREEVDEYTGNADDFHERHYNEFVTFLPYVQRFLYGDGRAQRGASAAGSPMRLFRRRDVARVRVVSKPGDAPLLLDIVHVDLYFFLDIDLVLLNVEVSANDLPLAQAQDLLYRFGRAYPAGWDAMGQALHCMDSVEFLDAAGRCWRARTRRTATPSWRMWPSTARRASRRTGPSCSSRWSATIRAAPARCASARSSTTACRPWPTWRWTSRAR